MLTSWNAFYLSTLSEGKAQLHLSHQTIPWARLPILLSTKANPRTADAVRGSFLLPYLIASWIVRLPIQSANVPVLTFAASPSALTFHTRRTLWPFRSFLHSRPKRKRSILPHKTTTLSSGAFYPMPTLRSTDRNIFLPASLDTVPILHHRNTRKEAPP